jgi:hypothetical protein
MTIASHLDLIFNVIRVKLCKLVANLDHLPALHCGFDYLKKKLKIFRYYYYIFKKKKKLSID